MDITTFLEVMSVQRHDFLNHLQVISGLIQLNKSDRVKEYIRQISHEMESLSRVAHLLVPEVAAVMLVAHFQSGRQQVEVFFDIRTGIEYCQVPGVILAEVLEEAFNQSLECILSSGLSDRCLKVAITESGKNYLLKFSFPEPSFEKAEMARDRLAKAAAKMVSYGGKAGVAVSGSGGEIFIIFPIKPPEQDSFGT